MNEVNAYGTLLIDSNEDIDRYYEIIHNKYLSKITKPSVELREWMCLISFLQKNQTEKCNVIQIHYPFTIQKRERPDFNLVMKDTNLSIEIAKITAKNYEALMTLAYKRRMSSWEPDNRLYNDDVRMTKKELMGLFREPGEPFYCMGMGGNYKQEKWSELCYKAILNKSEKKYKMDMLLLDDQHIQSCHADDLMIGVDFISHQLRLQPINISNANYIISENQSGLIVLFKKSNWIFGYKQYRNYDYDY